MFSLPFCFDFWYQVNFDDELEKVKIEMMQERAIALREQEDRLGSMVAQLQINKAKEVC